MSALWKKEVLISENSTISIEDALIWTENWLESFYVGKKTPALPDDLKHLTSAFNSQGNANYKNELRGTKQLDDYFADVFDSRVKPTPFEWRVYHSACKSSRGLDTLVYLKTPKGSLQFNTVNKAIEHIRNNYTVLAKKYDNMARERYELRQTDEQNNQFDSGFSPIVLESVVVDVGEK
jgi:hypothetical protein